MVEKKWRTLSGVEVNLRQTIEQEMQDYPDIKGVIVATDSQQIGKETEYVTVVTVHRPSKGGRVFYCRERVPRIRDLHQRLWKEAWMSTELAMELTTAPDIGGVNIKVIEIHIDANIDKKFKSSKYVEELVGLVVGQGFSAIVKPDAWAASHAADHVVKHKNQRGISKKARRRAA